MAIRNRTAPARAGECSATPARLIASGGPVTRAIQVRGTADEAIEALRRGLEDHFAGLGLTFSDAALAARIEGRH